MVDYALQRLNMVESQVRPSELLDRRIATAMLALPREQFLPSELTSVAYSDGDLSLAAICDEGDGERVALAPRTVAQMMQGLELEADHVVLLIGAGSGYEVALAANIAQMVVALETSTRLGDWVEKVMAEQTVDNAVLVRGAFRDGYAEESPYDAILVNGCVHDMPDALLDQLKDGGRLVAGVMGAGLTRITQWKRVGELFPKTELAPMANALLPGFEREETFVFG